MNSLKRRRRRTKRKKKYKFRKKRTCKTKRRIKRKYHRRTKARSGGSRVRSKKNRTFKKTKKKFIGGMPGFKDAMLKKHKRVFQAKVQQVTADRARVHMEKRQREKEDATREDRNDYVREAKEGDEEIPGKTGKKNRSFSRLQSAQKKMREAKAKRVLFDPQAGRGSEHPWVTLNRQQTALPPHLRLAPSSGTSTGNVPGETVQERLRRQKAAHLRWYWRTHTPPAAKETAYWEIKRIKMSARPGRGGWFKLGARLPPNRDDNGRCYGTSALGFQFEWQPFAELEKQNAKEKMLRGYEDEEEAKDQFLNKYGFDYEDTNGYAGWRRRDHAIAKLSGVPNTTYPIGSPPYQLHKERLGPPLRDSPLARLVREKKQKTAELLKLYLISLGEKPPDEASVEREGVRWHLWGTRGVDRLSRHSASYAVDKDLSVEGNKVA